MLKVYSRTVIFNGYEQHARAVARLKTQRAFGWFAQSRAYGQGLTAMIDSVS
jgi:hypothetical protein